MEIKIDLNELRKKSLFIGMPAFGGMVTVNTMSSLNNLTGKMAQLQVNMRCHFLSNESLVTRARNYIVDEFLRSDCTHMMFIDADIGFKADDVITMLALSNDDSPYDILTMPYPKKVIAFEKIVHAINVAPQKGIDFNANPNLLENYVGDFVFNFPTENKSFKLDEPVEVMEGGTGLMMMRRNVFTEFAKAYPELRYNPDHARTEHFSGDREIMAYFDTVIDPESKRYLSEDYMFCVPASSMIVTEDGNKRISEIVKTCYTGKVLSYNFETNKTEWKNVINHSVISNNKFEPKRWLRLNNEYRNNTKPSLICTDDHKVAYVDDILSGYMNNIKYTESSNMTDRYMIRYFDENRFHKERKLFNNNQLGVVIGSMLGDSCISKNNQLQYTHGISQQNYLEYKLDILDENTELLYHKNEKGFNKDNPKVSVRRFISGNAQTRRLRDLFYENGKKQISNILKYVDEIALAFWYMDDGSKSTSYGCELHTESFTKEENEQFVIFFKERFNLDAVISEKVLKYKNEYNTYYYLRFNKDSTYKLHSLISKYIPECMEYKLIDEYKSGNKHEFNKVRLPFAAEKVKSVEYIDIQSRLYDIEVEDNHNFFANGSLVHNCQYARKIGLKVWMCPWVSTEHVGTYVFKGSFPAIAKIGASATYDKQSMIKNRKQRRAESKLNKKGNNKPVKISSSK